MNEDPAQRFLRDFTNTAIHEAGEGQTSSSEEPVVLGGNGKRVAEANVNAFDNPKYRGE